MGAAISNDVVKLKIVNPVTKESVKKILTPLKSRVIDSVVVKSNFSNYGVINANYRYFTPAYGKNNAKTLVKPYFKPVTRGHRFYVDNPDDPDYTIGRVIKADYLDINNKIGKLSGYFSVTSYNAINKFLDLTYQNLSLGYLKAGKCSICGEANGRCEHIPGNKYDNKLAYTIYEKVQYDHLAVVNSPADESAIVQEIYDVSDISGSNVIGTVKGDYGCYTIEGDTIDVPEINNSRTFDLYVAVPSVNGDSKTVVGLDYYIQNSSDIDDSSVYLFTGDLNIKVGDNIIADNNNNDDEILELNKIYLKEINGDTKLSSTDKNKLKDSDFCGPDRTFPVTDCSHAASALRLVGKSKLSDSQKEKIIKCVNNKIKVLKCESGDSSHFNYGKLLSEVGSMDLDLDKLTTSINDLTQSIVSKDKVIAELEAKLGDAVSKLEEVTAKYDAIVKQQGDQVETISKAYVILSLLNGDTSVAKQIKVANGFDKFVDRIKTKPSEVVQSYFGDAYEVAAAEGVFDRLVDAYNKKSGDDTETPKDGSETTSVVGDVAVQETEGDGSDSIISRIWS